MIVAVTGYRGRLGRVLAQMGATPLVCDLTNSDEVYRAVVAMQPHVIINCAAKTNVDACEADEDYLNEAIQVNAFGPFYLRKHFHDRLIHVSTGYVLGGRFGPQDEDAFPEPVNMYGFTKLAGETAARTKAPTLVVRTLDLYHPDRVKPDFVSSVLDQLERGEPFDLPDNLYGNPTHVSHLAVALMKLATDGPLDNGVLNVAGETVLSRFQFGRMIAETFGHPADLIRPTRVINGAAPRPLRGGLIVDKAQSLGIRIRGARVGLDDYLISERADAPT